MIEDRLAQVEHMLDIIGDIDPTDTYEVTLLDERDELRYVLNRKETTTIMSIDKAELFDRILSSTCPSNVEDDGSDLFVYDLHCGEVHIIAKHKHRVFSYDTTDRQYQYTMYDIINVEWK